MFRILPTLCLLPAVLLFAGCNIDASSQPDGPRKVQTEPIATGELVSGTLWNKPVGSPGENGDNSGSSPPEGSRVAVYEDFIIVTSPDGKSELSLHGWYTNLTFKQGI